MSAARVAVLGFHLESNSFAAPSEERHFRSLCYMEGDDISREARKEVSALPAEIPAFYREMDTLGSWVPVSGCGPDAFYVAEATRAHAAEGLSGGLKPASSGNEASIP